MNNGCVGCEASQWSFVEWYARFNNAAQQGRLRRGQALYNFLYETRPGLAVQLDGTDLDPFFDDTRLPAALEWIGERWEAGLPPTTPDVIV